MYFGTFKKGGVVPPQYMNLAQVFDSKNLEGVINEAEVVLESMYPEVDTIDIYYVESMVHTVELRGN